MNKTHQQGHTLVELLTAIFIISIAIVGAMQLISFNVSNAATIRNNLIASGLVQEGVELVRNIRDNDWHEGAAGGFGGRPISLTASLHEGTQWRVSRGHFELLDPNPTQPIRKSSEGRYGYNAVWENTIFYREVDIVHVSPIHIQVDVKVTWEDRRGDHEVNAQVHLYDWK